MRSAIYLKFISWVMLVVVSSFTLHCVRESAHAMQERAAAAGEQTSDTQVSAQHHCPCSPVGEHTDYDDCDSCADCACHAHLTVQPFQFISNPTISDLCMIDSFRHLPEVYLTRFIPPQIQA